MMPRVTLYGRPGCHLCSDALALLKEIRAAGKPFEINPVNIENDPDLHRKFLERIPVIEADGRVLSELIPNRDTLRRSLDTLGT